MLPVAVAVAVAAAAVVVISIMNSWLIFIQTRAVRTTLTPIARHFQLLVVRWGGWAVRMPPWCICICICVWLWCWCGGVGIGKSSRIPQDAVSVYSPISEQCN